MFSKIRSHCCRLSTNDVIACYSTPSLFSPTVIECSRKVMNPFWSLEISHLYNLLKMKIIYLYSARPCNLRQHNACENRTDINSKHKNSLKISSSRLTSNIEIALKITFTTEIFADITRSLVVYYIGLMYT
jgi:hypothetical protein